MVGSELEALRPRCGCARGVRYMYVGVWDVVPE